MNKTILRQDQKYSILRLGLSHPSKITKVTIYACKYCLALIGWVRRYATSAGIVALPTSNERHKINY